MSSPFVQKIFTRIAVKVGTKLGNPKTINSQVVTVFDEDGSFNVLYGLVAAVPADGGAGYSVGAEIIDSTTGKVYQNEGSTASSTFNSVADVDTSDLTDNAVTSPKLAEGAVQFATVSIAAANIKTLRATPVELVAAPGADKVLELVSATLGLDFGSEVLAESADNLAVRYTDGSGVIVSQTIETTGFIDQSVDTLTNALPVLDAIVAATGSVNQALVLHNTGDGEFTGNASDDAALDVHIAYRVLTAGF